MEEEKAISVKEGTLPEVKKDVISTSNVQTEMEKLIPYAGTIILTEDQKKILFAPVKDEDIEIRPDGLVYLPWMEYVSRLRDAFEISWAVIPKEMPKFQGNHIYWPFYLMIQGKLAGFAIGEQEYQPSNARMTYGDAVEGAKSNALMRLCKGLGISLELWKPSFVRGWKEKYAESYEDIDRRGQKIIRWRKKNGKQEKVELVEPEQDMTEIHKESAKKCSVYHDQLVKIENKTHLQNWWNKHGKEAKDSLLPEHFEIIDELKNSMKEKLV